MKPEIKKLWVDALRSGDYQKGTGALRRYRSAAGGKCEYCALGVLCDIYIKETGATLWEETDRDYYGIRDADDVLHTGSLPSCVVDWAGLPGCDPYMSTDEERLSVSEFNDHLGMALPVIANYIERQL